MITPRWYQLEALNALFDYFSKHSGNPLVAWPTGTGKSILPALFIYRVLQQWPNQRFMLLTHVKKLIAQNASKLLEVWPEAPLGIYSAGLGRKEVHHPIVYGGIASVKNNIEAFGHRDIVFVDEAHLISPDAATMYAKVFATLLRINPRLKVIGLSATCFRAKQGLLTEDGLFTNICHDITSMEGFKRLIAEGHLAPLMARATETKVDISRVSIQAGEFNQRELEEASNQDKVTLAALKEALYKAQGRHCGLIFASGIDHANRVVQLLEECFGESCVAIHSKTGKNTQETNARNDRSFKMWYNGHARWAVSKDMLTTGVDVPHLDVIIDLAATMSASKHVQKLGRGTRPAEGKSNCLYLGFVGNIERLGPIDNPKVPNPRNPRKGDAPVKICPVCSCYNHTSARQCAYCGHIFEMQTKIQEEASESTVMLAAAEVEAPKIELFDVNYVIYNKHEKTAGAVPTMRVTYFCDAKRFNEWICFEHGGYPRQNAINWWNKRHATPTPATVAGALQHIAELRMPKRIKVWTNKTFPEVMGYEY